MWIQASGGTVPTYLRIRNINPSYEISAKCENYPCCPHLGHSGEVHLTEAAKNLEPDLLGEEAERGGGSLLLHLLNQAVIGYHLLHIAAAAQGEKGPRTTKIRLYLQAGIFLGYLRYLAQIRIVGPETGQCCVILLTHPDPGVVMFYSCFILPTR